MRPPRQTSSSGFTLIELMIVILIILILASVAIPIYNRSIIQARESVLRQDLYTLRQAIDEYGEDKQKAPQSLDDLVSAGYLRKLPKDPFTNSSETWQTEQEDAVNSLDQTDPGIGDVHSGSSQVGTDGTPYSEW